MAAMAQPKADRPEIAEFSDHAVITPPNRLVKAVSKVSLPDDDPIARAEAALAQLSTEFSKWMDDECNRLDAARKAARKDGVNKKNVDAMFHAAHDIKGQAETYGYPLVAPVADCLCRVLEHSPEVARIPVELIDQHVDAIRAIVRENARPDLTELAVMLTRKLRDVSDEFLAVENRHRPEYLAGVLSPPLAPEQF
jgi:chemotaxis protein histidine kinase CheA